MYNGWTAGSNFKILGIGPKIAKSGIVIQFRYSEPEAMTTINARDKPTQAGAYVDVIHGPCDLKPAVLMSMKADVAAIHRPP